MLCMSYCAVDSPLWGAISGGERYYRCDPSNHTNFAFGDRLTVCQASRLNKHLQVQMHHGQQTTTGIATGK